MDGDNFEEFDPEDKHFKALLRVGTLNSDAFFLNDNKVINKREVKGDASEAAIIKFCEHT